MSQSNMRSCNWNDCADMASKHVTYNYQVGEIQSVSEHESTIPISIHHANLCDSHVSELRKHHPDVNERDLGSCSETCPIR
jgi:hypothetical protein